MVGTTRFSPFSFDTSRPGLNWSRSAQKKWGPFGAAGFAVAPVGHDGLSCARADADAVVRSNRSENRWIGDVSPVDEEGVAELEADLLTGRQDVPPCGLLELERRRKVSGMFVRRSQRTGRINETAQCLRHTLTKCRVVDSAAVDQFQGP